MKKQFLAVTSIRKLLFIVDRLRCTSWGVFGLDGNYSFAQFPIARYFLENPDATPQIKRLSEYSSLSSGAMSQAVDLYVNSGILERAPAPDNRRSIGVSLSDLGRQKREETLAYFDGRFKVFEEGLKKDQLAKFRQVLCHLFTIRSGCEHLRAKRGVDLCRVSTEPLPIEKGESAPETMPSWMLMMHCADCIRFPIMQFHYTAAPGRTTIGKLRSLNYLFSLHGRKNLPMIKDFADRFTLPSAAVTQTLNALSADGMINRIPGPKDRRVTLIALTEKGERFYSVCTNSFVKYMKAVFDELPQAEIEGFAAVLEEYTKFLSGERIAPPANIPAARTITPEDLTAINEVPEDKVSLTDADVELDVK